MLIAALVVAGLLVGYATARAQTTGVINGYIYKRQALVGPNAVVPARHIEVRLINGDEIVDGKTDKNGFFTFVSVPPGVYYVLPGRYGWGCYPYVEVSAGQTTSLRYVMYIQESVYPDCAFRDPIIGPG
jgi:hypothetical protein